MLPLAGEQGRGTRRRVGKEPGVEGTRPGQGARGEVWMGRWGTDPVTPAGLVERFQFGSKGEGKPTQGVKQGFLAFLRERAAVERLGIAGPFPERGPS